MKIITLAYRLRLSPQQLSQMAHELNIKKYHNDYGEEFFTPKDTKKIIHLFKQAAQMKISPLFLLSAQTRKKHRP